MSDNDVIHPILNRILSERHAQIRKWGEQRHKQPIWLCIAMEELGELAKATIEPWDDTTLLHLEDEWVQLAAVCAAAIESLRKDYASG